VLLVCKKKKDIFVESEKRSAISQTLIVYVNVHFGKARESFHRERERERFVEIWFEVCGMRERGGGEGGEKESALRALAI